MGTVIQSKPQRNDDRQARWDRLERANLFEQYCELRTQGISQRQAAHQLEVPRTTLQAWQVYQERLDEEPAVVAFFQSPPGLAFLHRLMVGLHLVLQSRRRPCLPPLGLLSAIPKEQPLEKRTLA